MPDSKPDADRQPAPPAPPCTLNNRPDDPNRAGADTQFPPGVDPESARDPGRMTPDAPKVDNRS